MSAMSEETPGTTNARLSRLEAKYDDLAKQVEGAVHTIARVEDNQKHAEELNKLRFGALDTAVSTLTTDLKGFMGRIEGIISGDVQTAQSRQGAELVADYQRWRAATDTRLDAQDVRNGQLNLIGKVVWGLVGGNIVAIVGFIYFLATRTPGT